jgi:hypothetical protein
MHRIKRLTARVAATLAALTTIVACGGSTEPARGTSGPPPTGAALSDPTGPWASVAVGDSHTCALTKSGVAYCWGQNDRNQLGDGTSTARSSPTLVKTSLRFTSIAAGLYTSCAIAQSGDAYCWGAYNDAINAPKLVELGGRFTSLAVAQSKVCGLAADGAVYCWSTIHSDPQTPTRLSGNVLFRTLVSVLTRFCGIATDGQVYCWIDDAPPPGSALHVQPVATSPSLTSIVAGDFIAASDIYFHGCAVRADALAVCWGSNGFGQLGDSTFTARATSVQVSGGLKFSALAAAEYRACGVTTGGEMYCWGAMAQCYEASQISNPPVPPPRCTLPDGRVGATATARIPYPVRWLAGTRVASMVVGSGHTCAVTGNGAMYCWGANTAGQLGRGMTGDSSIDMQQVTEPAT